MNISPIRLLSALVVGLAATLGWFWFDQQGQLRGLNWAAPQVILPDLKTPALVAPADPNTLTYTAILERPLFAADRRPAPPPPPPKPPPPPDPLADIKIYGVYSGEKTGMLARIEGKMRRVNINETIGLWVLKSVENRVITLTQGAETRELQLAYARLDTPKPVAPRPVGAVPQPDANAGAPATSRNPQDEAREYQRRRNEARAARGLPPAK